jgi:hypothetical protein
MNLPITYDVDESRNVVYATVQGIVHAEDFLDYARRFQADPRIKPGYRELIDARAATPGEITPELFDQVAALDRERPEMLPGSRTAIVVPSVEGFDLARQYERKAQVTVIVFTSLDVAKTWLGLV